jgi:two-component system chemotaxis sensor kinase CheA
VTLTEYLAPHGPSFAATLALGLDELRDAVMPTELILDQMPRRLISGERTFDVAYSAIGDSDPPEGLLVIISDITESVARERAEQEQKELMTLFRLVSEDAAGVEAFLVEAAHLAATLRDEESFTVQYRLLHTLKGNCATFGLATFAALAHSAESELMDTGTALCATRREALVGAWKQTVQRVGWLLGSTRRSSIVVDAAELQALTARVAAGASGREIGEVLSHWALEPVRRGCERLARQVAELAQRLDKPQPELTIEDRGLRVDGERFAPFWTAMVHVVRNALDHGIEDPEIRALAGKAERGSIVLEARREHETLTILVRDDGRGLNWAALARAAEAHGLPHETREELIEALFTDGVTTCAQATHVSGRGVGMAAIRQVVQELGGSVEVDSTEGRGTEFRFVFSERERRVRNPPRQRLLRASLLPSAP